MGAPAHSGCLHDQTESSRRTRPPSPRDAWSASALPVRAAAATTAVVALAATASNAVPVASGATVAVLVASALVDLRHRRLPDPILAVAVVVFAALTAGEAIRGRAFDPIGIALGALAMGTPLLTLHLASPSSMGFGDVKVAVALGAALGAVDWRLAVAGLALAAGAGATVGIVRGLATIPLGPALVAAAALCLASHPLLLDTPAGAERTAHDSTPSTRGDPGT